MSEKFMENQSHLLLKNNLSKINRIMLRNIKVKQKECNKINLNVFNAIRR
jgi:hypothetical protein